MQIKSRPVPLCNSIIVAYASPSLPAHASAFFATKAQPRNSNCFTFLSLLKATSKSKSIPRATQIHSMSFKLGLLNHTIIQNALLHRYCSCGRLADARLLFDEMSRKDTVSYNTMIHGYAESGDMSSASLLFKGFAIRNAITWTTMISGYSKIGDVLAARRLFDTMPGRDLVSWNAMISGYLQNYQPVMALHLFSLLLSENLKPNRVTITSVLSACAAVGALDAGKWIHVFLNKNKFLLDPFLGCALIDMYSKCGVVEFALEVFASLKRKNTCTWNAIINGLAMNGYARQALDIFSQMELDKTVRADEITFVGVLMACSHGGFLEEGRRHFHTTSKRYGVSMILENYACMVDLLGRCGQLKEAEEIIRSMPMTPDAVVWRALLGGCRIHRDVQLAERILSEMEVHGSGDYVLLSNLYASVGRWEDVENIRQIMKSAGIKKAPGCSSIEINSTIHEFITGDTSHPRYVEIIAKLEELGKKIYHEEYVAMTGEVLYDIDEEDTSGTWTS